MRRIVISFVVILVFPGCTLPASVPASVPSTTPAVEIATPTSLPQVDVTESPIPILRRGINMGNMLEAPNEGEWGLTVQEAYFDLIREAGFDFVRLPVRWNAHAQQEWPYQIDPIFLSRVDEVVNWALERDLTVILDFHHYEEMASDPWSHRDRFLGIWRQLAEHYAEFPADLVFELLNEPHGQLDASLWNQYLSEALGIVRESNPARQVVIGPVHWNAYDWLSTLDVPDDEHLIVTFHYYLPFEFTHQGAEWVGAESEGWLGRTWGTAADQAEVAQHFDAVADWSRRRNVRILLGEFGVYGRAEMDSRVRWTEFVRIEAERRGFAWAYWELASGFGVYDPESKVWRGGLLKALIP